MNYGFVIDNDSCIGCHACSTACKSENDVPLGVHRTWVKTVETGSYPNVRRSFQVTRCNHCANPPCVRICPVTAMYQRGDGIVEFDPDVCIGCKACLQACPYDAIYMDPETGSAAKCHYCAHRVEVGLEPACVVVCPEHAIIAGDLDDPESEISRVVAASKVTVRKPEQGTAPKLFYKGGEDAALHPTATEARSSGFAWSDVVEPRERPAGHRNAQGLPEAGPIQIGKGRMAEQMVQVVWNAQHKVPWHWPVPAYLVTKAVAAGLFLIVAWKSLFGSGLAEGSLAASISVVAMLGATTALLVYDLEHPTRFLRILTRPQWKSWLVRGAFILVAFSGLSGLWLLSEVTGIAAGWLPWLMAIGAPLALGAAIYTAYLFGQAEGRDMWQSALLPLHMLVQSVMAGAAWGVLLGLDGAGGILAISALLHLLIMLTGDVLSSHASDTAAQAAHAMVFGRYRNHFWIGAVVLGCLIPALLVWLVGPVILAGALALVGLFLYEQAFVSAPQTIPNS